MIYEYKCICGNIFSLDRKICENIESAPCLECSGIAKIVITGGCGVIFKGDGFTKSVKGSNG